MNLLFEKITNQNVIANQIELPNTAYVYGVETAPRFKTANHNELTIWYDDDPHIYFLLYPDGTRLPLLSVTTLLHLFEKPFDEERMSYRCADKAEYNCECLNKEGWEMLHTSEKQERIKMAWKQNSEHAATFGTTTHAVMEELTINPDTSIENAYKMMTVKYNHWNDIIRYFANSYIHDIRDPWIAAGYELIAEPLIFDLHIMTAGQADLVAINHQTKMISVLDFKTNKRKPSKDASSYNKMEGIFNDLPQIDYWKYAFQLCLYQWFISLKYPGYVLGNNYILYMNRESGKVESIEINPTEIHPYLGKLYEYVINIRPQLYGF